MGHHIRSGMRHDKEPRQCRRRASHKSPNEHVPCVGVCVFTASDKSTSANLPEFAERYLHAWLLCVCVLAIRLGTSHAPKTGGVPTYDCSLLQYWTNKMMTTATQSRQKSYGRSPPVRVKHFISCSYRDLGFLSTHLDGITTETYTAELAKKTEDRGDCCMMSICEWGDWNTRKMSVILMIKITCFFFIGEFTFKVHETCLSSDHNIFIVAPADRDARNPILVHLKPSDLQWREKRTYIPHQKKQERKERRKATQKSNKRKGFGDPSLDESGSNWDNTGYGGSSSSAS